jgi:hypothetical protein
MLVSLRGTVPLWGFVDDNGCVCKCDVRGGVQLVG